MTESRQDATGPLVDYYFSLVSPWAYIGHELFLGIAAEHGAGVRFLPVGLPGVFAASGGLPLSKRAPARVAYRMVELQRWRDKRGMDFALRPAHWPFDPAVADACVIALVERDESPADFISAAFVAVFEEERDLADHAVLAKILEEAGYEDAAAVVEAAQSEKIRAAYARNAQEALAAGVFGSPAYVRQGEVFWGQDRLELLDEALASGRAPYSSDV